MKNPNETERLFAFSKDNSAEIAKAFIVYGLAPFFGVIFLPGAFIYGLLALKRGAKFNGSATARRSLFSAAVIFIIQILLWRLLTLAPMLHH